MRDGFLAVVTGQGSLSKAPARAGRDERAKRDQARVSPRRTRLDSRWGRRGQAKASRILPIATRRRRRGTECGRRASEGLFWPNAACSNQPASTEGDRGQVAEWLNAPHSKCGIPARVSGVQIPPCPPFFSAKILNSLTFEPRIRFPPRLLPQQRAVVGWRGAAE